MDLVESPIKMKLLDEHSFYYGMRNEFTQERFAVIRERAINLPEPPLYGTYLSNKHHLDVVDLLLMSTNETRHRGLFLHREVLPRLSHRCNKLLDIGPGGGLITKWIASSFKHLTIVDNNPESIQRISTAKNILRKHTQFEAMHGSILDLNLKKDYYDLVLFSHVLYYIDQEQWVAATKRVYDAIAPGGWMVIALNGDQYGKADLIKHFGGETINTKSYVLNCAAAFLDHNVEIFKSIEIVKTKDINSMLHIAGLFLSDSHTVAQKNTLQHYIENHFKTSDAVYEIKFSQTFMLVHKPFEA